MFSTITTVTLLCLFLHLVSGYNSYRTQYPRDVSYYGPGISVRIGNQMPPHHEPDAILINVGNNQPAIPGGNPGYNPANGAGPFIPQGGSGGFVPPGGPGGFVPPEGPGGFLPPGNPNGFVPPGGHGIFGQPGRPGVFPPYGRPGFNGGPGIFNNGNPGVFAFPGNVGGFGPGFGQPGHFGGNGVLVTPGGPNLHGPNNGFGISPELHQPRLYPTDGSPNNVAPGTFPSRGFVPQNSPPPNDVYPRRHNGGREIYDDPIAEMFPLRTVFDH